MLDANPIEDSAFGVEIHGLDLNRELGDTLLADIIALLHEHRLVIIKDQKLSEASYIAFGARDGTS